jgi:PiT family inorganic phosphate transporter
MHGANDAQKTMGIIAGVLFTAGYLEKFEIPFWVVLAAHAAIGLGTLSGGWRIIHTMGTKITKRATRRLSAVRWGVAGQIVWAWVLTIPASAAIGALCYGVLALLGG